MRVSFRAWCRILGRAGVQGREVSQLFRVKFRVRLRIRFKVTFRVKLRVIFTVKLRVRFEVRFRSGLNLG